MKNRIRLALGCDLRTLALFRICLALLIMVDLLSRVRDLKAHYTDWGILPRTALLESSTSPLTSLHLLGGSSSWQLLLFALSGVIALCLLVGYRTRLATIASWLLITSLQARNPIILQGGDQLLKLLLFWGIFLPLGARFAIDSALDNDERQHDNQYFSLATVALFLQCMSVYFFSALLKNSPEWIPEGTAVLHAMSIDHITTPIGLWLREQFTLQAWLSYYVWYLELIGPFLMLAPFLLPWLRLGMQALFISMHLGFFACLKIGLFPFVSITSLLSFTPGWVWDRIGAKLRTPERLGIRIYYDVDCGFCRKVCLILREFLLVREVPITPAQDDPAIHAIMRTHNSWVVMDHAGKAHVRFDALAWVFRCSALFWPVGKLMQLAALAKPGDRFYETIATHRGQLGKLTAVWLPFRGQAGRPAWPAELAIGILMIAVVFINIATLPGHKGSAPNVVRSIRDTLSLGQTWNMFAPHPMDVEGWYVVRGIATNGSVLSVLREQTGEPDWTRPVHLGPEYPNYRWRKYLTRIWKDKYRVHQAHYAQYLCDRWNRERTLGRRLKEVQLYFMREPVLFTQETRPVEKIHLLDHSCVQPSTSAPAPVADQRDVDAF